MWSRKGRKTDLESVKLIESQVCSHETAWCVENTLRDPEAEGKHEMSYILVEIRKNIENKVDRQN